MHQKRWINKKYKGVKNQGGFVRGSNLYLMADPEENGGSRRNIILKKNKKKFSQRHESSNPKYNMIIEQEKNKEKQK